MRNASWHLHASPVLGIVTLILSFCSPSVLCQTALKDGPTAAILEDHEWRIAPPAEDRSQSWPHRGLLRRTEAHISLHGGTIDGSTGCYSLAGTYHGSGRRISMDVRWINASEMTCDDDDRSDASQIVAALNRVRSITAQPSYWREAALHLADAKNQTQLVLSPMKTGGDLSDLSGTFWSLSKLDGLGSRLSDAVIWIRDGDITFSSRSCYFSYPFSYTLRGLEFFPAWARETDEKNPLLVRDLRIAADFERALHRITSYRVKGNTLFFSTREQPSSLVLNRIQGAGIEARSWRIASFRSDQSKETDGLTTAKELALITFLHGRVEGTPGCGAWVGSYSLDHDRLTVKADYALAGRCSSDGAAQGVLVVKALNGDLNVEHEGNQVHLRRANGLIDLVLVPF